MAAMPRRGFLGGLIALPFFSTDLSLGATGASQRRAVRVAVDEDRFGRRRTVFGSLPIDVKVSTADSDGGLLLIEQIDDRKGGPPRHVHHRQDEWFYVVRGDYEIEVGDERFVLGPGDSLLAPRGVPHVWAHTGDGTGRMLIGFQPAGEMEDFFAQATTFDGIPAGPELARLFSEHGMEILGPPLAVG